MKNGVESMKQISDFGFIVTNKKLRFRQVLWMVVGSVSVALATVGIFLPVLPTVPLYLLASFSFLNSSDKLYNKFRKSKLYIKYMQPYLDAGGISKRGKVILISYVTLQIGVVAFLLRNSAIALVMLIVLYLGFLISMLFVVKTVSIKKEK